MNGRRRIQIFDTTLRDGDQSPGFSFTLNDKIRIAEFLERMGVDVIEAGFPASSHAQYDAVREIASRIENATVTAMSRALPSDIVRAAKAIKSAKKPMLHTSIATSPLHREWKLKMTRQQILRKAVEAVKCAKAHVGIVEIGAEDATRTETEFLSEFCSAVTEAGADIVNISDTVGYSQPAEFARLIRFLKSNVSAFADGSSIVSVHCHNDLGLAVANTLAGIEAGAMQAECTLLGVGERAGNAAVEEIVTAFENREDYYSGIYTGIHSEFFAESARLITRVTGVAFSPMKAVVGRNAYAHASGIHQNGILANQKTYSMFSPESTGHDGFRFVLTRHSGSSGLRKAVQDITGKEINKEALVLLTEKFKLIADRESTVSSTSLLTLLNNEGITDSEIWMLADIGESKINKVIKTRIVIRSNRAEEVSIIEKCGAPWNIICEKLKSYFGYDIHIIEGSFSINRTGHNYTGKFFMYATYNGKHYYEEQNGNDETRMAIDSFLAIVNHIKSIIARDANEQ